MADFIPQLSSYTTPLFDLLKKNPIPWSSIYTKSVQALKKLSLDLPPLQIPSDGKRILQTNASDEYWAAILFEEKNHKRFVCGYRSGKFKDSEVHYHSTYKEILAVKRGIEKFQFHLIGHTFLVEMDMSSFPNMLKFKRKMLPQPQLLRWANWFSQWTFEVRHNKGKDNVIADFFSRPPKPPIDISPISPIIPCIYPIENMHQLIQELPPEICRIILRQMILARSIENFKRFLEITIFRNGIVFRGFKFHPDYPYLTPFHIHDFFSIPKGALCFLWYLCEAYTVAFVFRSAQLFSYLSIIQSNRLAWDDHDKNFAKFMTWFKSVERWVFELRVHYGSYVIITFHRPLTNPSVYHQASPSHCPYAQIQGWSPYNISKETRTSTNQDWTHFLNTMCYLNHVDMNTIPPEILWGYEVWNPEHPLSSRLIDHLFHFNEMRAGTQDSRFFPDGLRSPGTTEDSFVGYSSGSDREGWPDSDDTFG